MTNIDKIIEETRKEMMPFSSWELLPKESDEAFAAFRIYRDMGFERNIKKAIESLEPDNNAVSKCYGTWRNWAVKYRWRERVADYDRYIEGMKQGELRKTIEAQGEKHRQVTGKMLDVVCKKLDTMNPDDLSQGTVTEWVQTAIKAEREAAGLIQTSGLSPNGKTEAKQGELNFVSEFQGL